VLEDILKNVPDVSIVKFNKDDIVRSPVVMDIVAAFEEFEDKNEN